MTPAILAQVGFSSLFMLGWAGAALIPILLHLLKRRRQASIPWAAMQLLQKVIEQESRRAYLQQLLLVALRVAILLALALALSRPFWKRTGNLGEHAATRPNKLLIIVVDTSYSMGYRAGELTRLARAQQRIAHLVRDSQTGDAFALVAMAQPSKTVIGRPTFDGQSLVAEAHRLTDTSRGGDLLSALTIANNIAGDATKERSDNDDTPLPKLVEILILSDLGNDSWQTAVDGPAAKALHRISQLHSVTLESMVETKPFNVAIESVQPSTRRATVGLPLDVEVTIASFGAPVSALPVQLVLDGKTVASTEVDIESNGRLTVPLKVTPTETGTKILSVVTPADNLPIDNRVDLVIEVKSGYRILIVDSVKRRRERQGEGERGRIDWNPWSLALRPLQRDSRKNQAGEIRVISEWNWPTTRMQDWDIVIVNDPAWTTPSQIDRLISFVENGGSAIVALGEKHSMQVPLKNLLGYPIIGPSEFSDWTVDPLDYRSPVVKAFDGFPNSGLLTTPIFRYWRVGKSESTGGESFGGTAFGGTELHIDLATTTGDPLIVHRRLGTGKIAILLSAPEDGRDLDGRESWNAMVAWPSFLPLAQQLVQTALDVDSLQLNRLAGEPLTGWLPPQVALDGTDAIVLQRPDETEVQITLDPPDAFGRPTWTYAGTDQRGIYRALEDRRMGEGGELHSNPNAPQQLFAVYIDPIQSSLESVDPQAIRMNQPSDRAANATSAGPARPSPSDRFSRGLLLGLGLLLVAESLTAWWMGRRFA